MSLSVDGVWKSGVWATTVWADGVWSEGASTATPTGGKGDNERGRRRLGIVKPTGLVETKRRAPEGRKTVDERVADSIAIQEEAAGAIARQLREQIDEAESFRPVAQMSLSEIDREIGVLLRKKLRTEDDEVLLLMLMATAAAV